MLGIRDQGTVGCGEEAAAAARTPEPMTRGEEATPPGPAPCRISGLVNWRQSPGRTSALFAAANTVTWLVAFSSLRVYCLLAVLLVLLVVMATARDIARSRSTGVQLWRSMTTSWEMMDSGQDVRSGSGPQLSDSLRLFLQETSAFKQQNPGKFCLLVCSLCTFFAVLGRYIPGIVISYVLVLGFFLWPLVSTHDVGSWLDPVLQKLDFGVGEFFQKIKENHEKRMMQVQTEKEGIESDLSSMFPKLDSAVCKDMSVSDTEVSDVTWTDNGTFNLSEGHTPQTENSEDLDREEAFTGGLPEFPSLDNGAATNGDDDDSLGLPAPQLPIKLKVPPPATDPALQLVNKMAGEFIAAAVTAAMQERIEAAVGFPTGDAAAAAAAVRSRTAGPSALLELDSDSEVEDFELLDQSELEQLEGELGLEEKAPPTEAEAPPTEAEAPPTEAEAPPTGFFSKLLRR